MKLDVRELSPRGSGAISVVAVRGVSALARVREFSRAPISIGVPCLARLVICGEELDEALVCALDEHTVEIHLHGSPVLVRGLMAALGSSSCATEVPSDLPNNSGVAVTVPALEERAQRLLCDAASDSAARILLDQAEGALRHEFMRLRDARDARAELDRLAERSRIARFAIEPALVVLAGPVNAGKSTLFNALVGTRAAIVSDEPGTTRDLVRERVLLGAYPIQLVDTAGERELARELDPRRGGPREVQRIDVERAGQVRARRERERADLCFWLSPAGTSASADAVDDAPSEAVRITTCADRVPDPPSAAISALRAPLVARETIVRLFRERFELPVEPWEPGAAVAFDAESRSGVDFVRASRSELELRQRLDALLGS